MSRIALVTLVAVLNGISPGAEAQPKPKVAVFGLEPMDLTPQVTKVAGEVSAAMRNLAFVSQQVQPMEGKDLVEIKMIFDCATVTPNMRPSTSTNETCIAFSGFFLWRQSTGTAYLGTCGSTTAAT